MDKERERDRKRQMQREREREYRSYISHKRAKGLKDAALRKCSECAYACAYACFDKWQRAPFVRIPDLFTLTARIHHQTLH